MHPFQLRHSRRPLAKREQGHAASEAIPVVDLRAQYATIQSEVEAAIGRVLEGQGFVLGPEVEAFEQEFAGYVGTEHAVGCASGSDALLLALMALGVGQGHQVICPAYTFFATASSIVRLGAIPVFADIDPQSWNLSPDSVRSVARRCDRLAAILPVDLFGAVADLDSLLDIAAEHEVPLVEDAAQAIGGADASGARAGTRGRVACFSLYPTKTLGAYGDAGAITTNDAELSERLRLLRVHGARTRYLHDDVGINSRLDALQAAVLRVKLGHLERWTRALGERAAFYDEHFERAGAVRAGTPIPESGLQLQTPSALPPPARHAYHQYCIRVPRDQRDRLRDRLAQRGIGSEIYYPARPAPAVLLRRSGLRGGRSPRDRARCAREPHAAHLPRDHLGPAAPGGRGRPLLPRVGGRLSNAGRAHATVSGRCDPRRRATESTS